MVIAANLTRDCMKFIRAWFDICMTCAWGKSDWIRIAAGTKFYQPGKSLHSRDSHWRNSFVDGSTRDLRVGRIAAWCPSRYRKQFRRTNVCAECTRTAPGRRLDAEGDSLFLSGRVLNLNGQPIANALIDVWQPNSKGLYDQDTSQPQGNFRGRFKTNASVYVWNRGATRLQSGSQSIWRVAATARDGIPGGRLTSIQSHPSTLRWQHKFLLLAIPTWIQIQPSQCDRQSFNLKSMKHQTNLRRGKEASRFTRPSLIL